MNSADEKKSQEIFDALPKEVRDARLKADRDRVIQNGKIMGILDAFKANPIPVDQWIRENPELISQTARNRKAKLANP